MSEKKPDTERLGTIPPFGLRMLPDLRERITAAAHASGRSLNAEITDRLERSLKSDGAQVIHTFEVLLDTNGMPTSWPEVYEHIRALTQIGKLNVVQMTTLVLTPEILSGQIRSAEAEKLGLDYKKLLKRLRASMAGLKER